MARGQLPASHEHLGLHHRSKQDAMKPVVIGQGLARPEGTRAYTFLALTQQRIQPTLVWKVELETQLR